MCVCIYICVYIYIYTPAMSEGGGRRQAGRRVGLWVGRQAGRWVGRHDPTVGALNAASPKTISSRHF